MKATTRSDVEGRSSLKPTFSAEPELERKYSQKGEELMQLVKVVDNVLDCISKVRGTQLVSSWTIVEKLTLKYKIDKLLDELLINPDRAFTLVENELSGYNGNNSKNNKNSKD